MKHFFRNFYNLRQITCLLLFDEVYLKSILLYYCGIVFGKAVNKPHLLANAILSFLIVILLRDPQFLCGMLTV